MKEVYKDLINYVKLEKERHKFYKQLSKEQDSSAWMTSTTYDYFLMNEQCIDEIAERLAKVDLDSLNALIVTIPDMVSLDNFTITSREQEFPSYQDDEIVIDIYEQKSKEYQRTALLLTKIFNSNTYYQQLLIDEELINKDASKKNFLLILMDLAKKTIDYSIYDSLDMILDLTLSKEELNCLKKNYKYLYLPVIDIKESRRDSLGFDKLQDSIELIECIEAEEFITQNPHRQIIANEYLMLSNSRTSKKKREVISKIMKLRINLINDDVANELCYDILTKLEANKKMNDDTAKLTINEINKVFTYFNDNGFDLEETYIDAMAKFAKKDINGFPIKAKESSEDDKELKIIIVRGNNSTKENRGEFIVTVSAEEMEYLQKKNILDITIRTNKNNKDGETGKSKRK